MENNNINLEDSKFIDLREGETGDNSSYDVEDGINDRTFDDKEQTNPITGKKKNSITKNTALILGGILLALAAIYLGGAFYFKSHFLPNTYISGFNTSFQSLDQANAKLDQVSHARKVSLVGKDAVVSDVRAEDIGLNLVNPEKSQQTLSEQNEYMWPLYLFHIYSNKSESENPYNEEALTNKLQELPIVNGQQVVKTENARADYNGTKFEVKDEVYGTEVNTDALKTAVAEALENGQSEIYLDKANCYVQPTLLKDNENLIANTDKLNTALNSVITYDFKSSQEVVDRNVFAGWLTTDDQGNVTINDTEVANYVQGLKDKYDTLGKEFKFKTSNGEEMSFTNWYTGWEIDKDSEVAALKDNILAGQPVTKEPVYSSTGKDRAQGTTISGTYLEISIGAQTMWYYLNGECLVSTPVVTGNVSAGNGTPTGLFELQDKSTNVVLRGDNGDGSQYASPVTFWMPFDGGIGVHDASWRGSFGGSIYRGDGSHGCVNTPYNAAKTIYENINIGDPVVVY